MISSVPQLKLLLILYIERVNRWIKVVMKRANLLKVADEFNLFREPFALPWDYPKWYLSSSTVHHRELQTKSRLNQLGSLVTSYRYSRSHFWTNAHVQWVNTIFNSITPTSTQSSNHSFLTLKPERCGQTTMLKSSTNRSNTQLKLRMKTATVDCMPRYRLLSPFDFVNYLAVFRIRFCLYQLNGVPNKRAIILHGNAARRTKETSSHAHGLDDGLTRWCAMRIM